MNAAPNDLSRQAERLTRLYILALSAVACLSIVGQFLVQWSLERQLSDSTVINLAGRQRMLSQWDPLESTCRHASLSIL